jgi:glycine/serine hydroxymethyltransferase
MREPEMKQAALWIDRVLRASAEAIDASSVAGDVRDFCRSYPVPTLV